jgi:hypothetical protein
LLNWLVKFVRYLLIFINFHPSHEKNGQKPWKMDESSGYLAKLFSMLHFWFQCNFISFCLRTKIFLFAQISQLTSTGPYLLQSSDRSWRRTGDRRTDPFERLASNEVWGVTDVVQRRKPFLPRLASKNSKV